MSASLTKYRNAFYVSQRFFDHLKIKNFPVNPFLIFPRKLREPIFVVSLLEYNSCHACPLDIKDAKCFYYPKKAYLIIYNDSMPENRIRFSLVHELAHIVLGHLDDERTEMCRGGLEDRIYCIMEGEANTFAGNFLAPPILIKEKLNDQGFSFSLISSFFGLSDTAVSSYRYKDYQEWLNTIPASYEKGILERCRERLFPKFCLCCESTFYGKESKFCPVCGNTFYKDIFETENDEEMDYSRIETDESGRAVVCARCGSEIVWPEGDYCMICGAPVFNHCACTEKISETGYNYSDGPCDAERVLPSGARFCPYCGNETTYFQDGLLRPWQEELREQQEQDSIRLLSKKVI